MSSCATRGTVTLDSLSPKIAADHGSHVTPIAGSWPLFPAGTRHPGGSGAEMPRVDHLRREEDRPLVDATP